MLTAAASAAGSLPHEMMEAQHQFQQPSMSMCSIQQQRDKSPSGPGKSDAAKREEELERAREHIRAAQWAFANASLVADCEQWEEDEVEDDNDWEDWTDTPASTDQSTPDWRGACTLFDTVHITLAPGFAFVPCFHAQCAKKSSMCEELLSSHMRRCCVFIGVLKRRFFLCSQINSTKFSRKTLQKPR